MKILRKSFRSEYGLQFAIILEEKDMVGLDLSKARNRGVPDIPKNNGLQLWVNAEIITAIAANDEVSVYVNQKGYVSVALGFTALVAEGLQDNRMRKMAKFGVTIASSSEC